jgi:hypothetical protein
MSKPCDPKNNVSRTRAINQGRGIDIVTEAERIKNFDGAQHAAYESQIAAMFGIKPNEKRTKSGWQALPDNKTKAKRFDRLVARVDETFQPKFWKAFDKRFEAWIKAGGKAEQFQDIVGKDARKVLDAINSIVERYDGKPKTALSLNKDLARLGLKMSDVYDAKQYLKWVSEGAYTKKDPNIQVLTDTAGNIAKAQANYNMLWTLGNGVDMIRVASYSLSRNGLVNTIKGFGQALKATKGNVFARQAELDKKGLYGSTYLDQGGKNISPFEWSITAQKNMAYHLDKAGGGDGSAIIRTVLFDEKPWMVPPGMRSDWGRLGFGLARYPINEARYIFKETKAALQGDKRAMGNMVMYHLTKAAVTGSASLIPMPLWAALNKDEKEAVKAFDDEHGLNIIKQSSKAAFAAFGQEATIDLTEYTQVAGGTLGARLGTVGNTGVGAVRSAGKTIKDMTRLNLPAAAVDAAATASAMANFSGNKGWFKSLPDAANSTTITKMLDTTGQWLRVEFQNDSKYVKELSRDAFGQTVKDVE